LGELSEGYSDANRLLDTRPNVTQWTSKADELYDDHVVNVHVGNLRRKLGNDMSTDELHAAHAGGKTVAQIASERGVDLDTVTAAALQAHSQGLDAQVQAGRLTSEQADMMQTHMTAQVGAMFSGQSGAMMGQDCMMGGGMMTSPGNMMGAGMMGPGHMSGPGHSPQR
jgi:hypothetical protein